MVPNGQSTHRSPRSYTHFPFSHLQNRNCRMTRIARAQFVSWWISRLNIHCKRLKSNVNEIVDSVIEYPLVSYYNSTCIGGSDGMVSNAAEGWARSSSLLNLIFESMAGLEASSAAQIILVMGMRARRWWFNTGCSLRVNFFLPVVDQFSEFSAVLVALLVINHHI